MLEQEFAGWHYNEKFKLNFHFMEKTFGAGEGPFIRYRSVGREKTGRVTI